MLAEDAYRLACRRCNIQVDANVYSTHARAEHSLGFELNLSFFTIENTDIHNAKIWQLLYQKVAF